MSRVTVQAGDRYGRMVILREVEFIGPNGRPDRSVECRCDCGTVKTVRLRALRDGGTVSCGCYLREWSSANRKRRNVGTHGQSNTSLFRIWCGMRNRCKNERNPVYKFYGARGIKVCDEWQNDFAAFAAYVGPRPDGMSLDRIDTNGNYEPGNVRWATQTEQCRNTRRNLLVERDGQVMTLAEAAERFGIQYDKARNQIKKGRTYEGFSRVSS